jgi:uncharacterized RDD family membrane protein YckC
MNQYEISTAQNATIRLTIANMGDRILAAIIDLFILGGYSLIGVFIYFKFNGDFRDNYDSNIVYWIYFGFSLPVYFYTLLFEYFMNGQTPGKRIMKVKVARLDGHSLTLGSCIIRWLFRIVDIWMDSGSVGIVTMTFSKLHQRIGDMVAGTIVISTASYNNKDLSQYTDPSYSNLTFPQVERLQMKDAEAIHDALALYYEKDKFDYVLQVSQQLKSSLDIAPDMDDLNFVKRILGDYNLMHQTALVSAV